MVASSSFGRIQHKSRLTTAGVGICKSHATSANSTEKDGLREFLCDEGETLFIWKVWKANQQLKATPRDVTVK